MLERGARRAKGAQSTVDLALMDAERLGFPDAVFDAAVATFAFCSVADPVQGLKEIGRVVKPGGPVVLLEHVRVNAPIVGPFMDLLDPLVLRLMGPHINRRTVRNVQNAGLDVERVRELAPGGLVKLIHARSR
jgi:ubiquinone/menaquinone biosynthesis C-methylase UbiE